MARASNKVLSQLHEKLATIMLEALDGEKFTDEEGVETVFKATNPALFTAIAKFLKDNDIVAIPETEDAVHSLRERLKNKAVKSVLPSTNPEDMQWQVTAKVQH